MPAGFVYIMTNKRNGTLYTGVTWNLDERVRAHREGCGSAFCKKYGVKHLVWFEEFPLYAEQSGARRTSKKWKRAWKLALIEEVNPNWDDLLRD